MDESAGNAAQDRPPFDGVAGANAPKGGPAPPKELPVPRRPPPPVEGCRGAWLVWHCPEGDSPEGLVALWDSGQTATDQAEELNASSFFGEAQVEFRWVLPGHRG